MQCNVKLWRAIYMVFMEVVYLKQNTQSEGGARSLLLENVANV